ncbi:PrnB family protein [Pseudoalteromonas luteoviolacea]|uniref:Indoleamine 2,3-dioxygenase n=1 Tax=Pseudoalteromonas luteoviolacea S4054 TaxID=1129367 RepID=A0A0F6AFB3_9GAMM|nr:monodechloroaminopyrrolnitrin synthase PrnB family protein [Pseudoalteromonas luteoviolacea]AOT10017.1 tryptophan 2,3-dioxygenase [Pseudoalteromonas luteoviolacea]AOT14928.1 tryptophan 2,3-dioxygenase [Pseudoalteromonas luteoviolacea]AOT19844.1 tryptophan 2,3-dioxygenase [Pseudoalteromonas luteoviolacea]KKE84902.1 indoleamine 2,3-dioxygenase [Pseudoalteromonas luteoviolacea S4054]KZN72519.1 indoleamine 2,3-dioxygenase [Pseudoalteromonas luteoviolacea S4047-1]
MTKKTKNFDDWIRTEFVMLNDKLEALYREQDDPANVEGVGDETKQQLLLQGQHYIEALLKEGNTDEGFDNAFDLLGNVGLYMASCRRHELTEPSRERQSPLKAASALAMHIGSSIGVTPRFATAHLTTHNTAINGIYKRFTSDPAEKLFIDYNTRGILAYKRAAEALLKVQPLGISHPMAPMLLEEVKRALVDVIKSNQALFQQLDTASFFYVVRPYYKPYRVGKEIYRGANAGDFAGINVIDMMLGLCQANDVDYAQILVEKLLYMMPEDQATLKECMRLPNLLDAFLDAQQHSHENWYQESLKVFLQACKLHGDTAIQHHNQLVEKYICGPAKNLANQHLDKVTASGPPLQVLLGQLETLRDKRAAAKRTDLETRYVDLNRLRQSLKNAEVDHAS